MDDSKVVLMVIFFAITAIMWVFFRLSGSAWLSYQQAFTSSAENNLEKMFMFFDPKKLFVTNGHL